MNKTPAKISSLEDLRNEKQRLKSFCTYQEKLIAYKVNELKENYPRIISETFLPFEQEENKRVSSLLDGVNEFIFKLFPVSFRENKFTMLILKLVQIAIIRTFSSRKRTAKTSAE